MKPDEKCAEEQQTEGHGDHADERCPDCLDEKIEKLEAWVKDLQSGMYINCVYCGHQYGPKDEVPTSMADVLKKHIEKCPEHPMSKLKADLNKYLGERDEALTKWHAHQKNVPCGGCEGGHDTYWGTIIKSPQWKAWEDSHPRWDVDECRECGHISGKHFQAFLEFCIKQADHSLLGELKGYFTSGNDTPVPSATIKGDVFWSIVKKAMGDT